jgi:hypothetical protein
VNSKIERTHFVYLSVMEVLEMKEKCGRANLKTKLLKAMEQMHKTLETCEQSADLRLSEQAFTRKRRLGAKRLLHLILLRVYHSLQLVIDGYYEAIEQVEVSKQAFSKSRKNLNPEFVRSFADMTSRLAAEDEAAALYGGQRLIAIDGSDVALENSTELKEAFGCSGPNRSAATAQCSLAFDPLNHTIYDCRLDRYETDERTLAKAHVARLLELGLGGSILLFDRGYPSAAFVAFLVQSGFDFVMRVRRKFNLEADEIKTQGWINLQHEGATYPVRVLKVKLENGEVETLLTSLNQKRLPIAKAAGLYFQRWQVEVAYDLLKSKLELENFSGKTSVAVQQDFYATVFLANLVSFANEEANALIQQQDEARPSKYTKKPNTSRTISKLRACLLRILTQPNPRKRGKMLDKLIMDIARRPLTVDASRKTSRKPPRRKRFNQGRRSVV